MIETNPEPRGGLDGSATPEAAYAERLAQRRATRLRLDRYDRRIAYARLAVAVAAVIIAWLAYGPDWLSPLWLFAPGAVFVALAVGHEVVLRRVARARLAERYYERGLERLAGKWQHGPTGEALAPERHLYARDLDIVGPGSLFTLLSTAQTPMGEETLGAWLLASAAVDEVRLRQEAARELAPRIDLREELYGLGAEVRFALRPATLVAWGEEPRWLGRGAVIAVVAVLAVEALSLAAFKLGAGPAVLVLALATVWAVTRSLKRRVNAVLALAAEPSRELTVLAALVRRLEVEPLVAPKLAGLRRTLDDGAASRAIKGLARRLDLADARANQLFAPFAWLLFWGPIWALAIEQWRAAHGRSLGRWLGATGELEALGSLGSYTFEHPDDAFPELVPGPTRYEADGLAHPFLSSREAVRNDVGLGADPRLLVVSGSNMSGKSTLLRSVGVSVVMTFAGAPVRARRLVVSPLSLGASIRVVDSLHGHVSRFYAEVQRLADIVAVAVPDQPLLFLLDELLHGTNSHDRREGARGVLGALLARGAVGLVTTHDLALTTLADDTTGARNVHFVDSITEGRLTFDYVLRPGVVQKSNALALMRAAGLPLPAPAGI